MHSLLITTLEHPRLVPGTYHTDIRNRRPSHRHRMSYPLPCAASNQKPTASRNNSAQPKADMTLIHIPSYWSTSLSPFRQCRNTVVLYSIYPPRIARAQWRIAPQVFAHAYIDTQPCLPETYVLESEPGAPFDALPMGVAIFELATLRIKPRIDKRKVRAYNVTTQIYLHYTQHRERTRADRDWRSDRVITPLG